MKDPTKKTETQQALHSQTKNSADLHLAVVQQLVEHFNADRAIDQNLLNASQVLRQLIPYDAFTLTVPFWGWGFHVDDELTHFESYDTSFSFNPTETFSASRWVYHNKRPILRTEISRDKQFKQDDVRILKGFHANLTVPLIVDDACIGALNFLSRTPNAYTQQHLDTLLSVSHSIAILINKLQERQEKEAIQKLAKIVQKSTDLDTIQQMALQHIQSQGYDRIRLYLYDKEKRALVGAAQTGEELWAHFETVILPLATHPYTHKTLKSSHPCIYRTEDPEFKKIHWQGQDIQSSAKWLQNKTLCKEWAEIGLKVVEQGQETIIGKIAIDNAVHKHPLILERLNHLIPYAEQIAITIRHAQLHQEANQHAAKLESAITKLEKEIADHKNTTQMLLKKDRQFTEAQELAHLGSWEWDIHTGQFIWSDEIYRILGVDPAQITPDTDAFLNAVHASERQFVEQAVTDALEGKKEYAIEFRIVKPSSEIRHIFSQGKVDHDKNGKPVRMIGTALDITQNKQQEETIREKTRLENALYQIAQTTLSTLDLNDILNQMGAHIVKAGVFRSLTISLVNPDANDIEVVRDFVYQANKDITARSTDAIGAKYPLDSNEIFAETARTGQMQIIEGWDERFGRQDSPANRKGQVAYFLPIKTRGQVIAVLATGSQVEDKKETLNRIESIQPLLSQLALTLENARLYEEVKKQNVEFKVTVEERTAELKASNKRLQKEIDEREQTEAQLRQAQKMEAVGKLAGGVAHDFNNLLTVINGYSKRLLTTITDEKTKEILQDIYHAGDRAASLTRQLLAFSRKQILKPEILNLNSLLINMSKILQRVIGEDIQFSTIVEPNLGYIKADPGQLEQVLMNLAINARDAMPKGGKLTVKTSNEHIGEQLTKSETTLSPGSYVVLSIQDTGTGMDLETQGRIFEPFFTTKEQGKGTGLGLSTVYGIVKQSEGYLFVDSEINKGTIFQIYLPQFEAEQEETERHQAEETLTGTGTILLVEDEDLVRTLAHQILTESGYTVLDAENGKKALELCTQHKGDIDLLVTDVVMPQMSGRELAESLIPNYPTMKVLYMSGYTDDAVIRHGVVESEVAFIQKPFMPEDLLLKTKEVLDS